MKFFTWGLVSLALFSFASAQAQTETAAPAVNVPQKTKAKRVRVPASEEAAPVATAPTTSVRSRASADIGTQWLKNRMTVGGYMASASDLSAESASSRIGAQTFTGAGNMSTESAIGVGLQIIEMKDASWGWFLGASLEQSREIASLNLNLGARRLQGQFPIKPKFLPLMVSGGGVYKFSDKIYGTAGLNYTIFNDFGGGSLANASMTPRFGYQYGVGFRPTPRVAIELVQRDARYSFEGTNPVNQEKITVDDMRLVGFNLIGRYEIQ